MVAYITMENLINNHATHHETHGRTQGKNETNGGAGGPVILFKLLKSLFGVHHHIPGQLATQIGRHLGGIAARDQLDQPQLNAAGRSVGHQPQEGFSTGKQVAIGAEGRSKGNQPDHAHPFASHFSFNQATLAEPGANRSELLAGTLIKNHPAPLTEQGGLAPQGVILQ